MTPVKPYCSACRAGALCGADQGEGPADCAAYRVERGEQVTLAQVVHLQVAIAQGLTQQLAGIMLLIERHRHLPDGGTE